jgi:hypothetical protein
MGNSEGILKTQLGVISPRNKNDWTTKYHNIGKDLGNFNSCARNLI